MTDEYDFYMYCYNIYNRNALKIPKMCFSGNDASITEKIQSKVFCHPQRFSFFILKLLFLMKQVKHHNVFWVFFLQHLEHGLEGLTRSVCI